MLLRFLVFILASYCASIPSPCLAQTKLSENRSVNLWTQEAGSIISPSLLLDANLWKNKEVLLKSMAFSLKYLESERANIDYQKLKIPGVDRERVIKSLSRFQELLNESSSYEELAQSISEEFILFKPKENSASQAVKFTGYFQPTYKASRTKTDKFKYPIYNLPNDFSDWPKPQPKRVFLEGYNGQGNPHSPLNGKELAFLSSRWEAFMIHVQGSAILELQDDTEMAVGFAGATDYPFRGVSKTFLQEHAVSWNNLAKYFASYPNTLDEVLARNNRYIFFKENATPMPIGSLGVPVIAERSIATDKSIMPPGALSVIKTTLPYLIPNGSVELRPGLRFVLDQDTGSAIKGSARVDIFMGTGPQAQKKANAVFSRGEFYYLLLR